MNLVAQLTAERDEALERVRQLETVLRRSVPLRPADLTPAEAKVLLALVEHGTCTRARLLTATARNGHDYDTSDNSLSVRVHHLRRKVLPYDICIKTVWGTGYAIEGDSLKRAKAMLDEGSAG